jgi:hypothetical protein
MEVPNYNGENMLVGANLLYIKIKNFINEHQGDQSNSGFVRYMLVEYLKDIDEYIRDITAYNFAPRTDRLTKEGILIDLENTKTRINGLLSSGGRRRKSIRRKTSRKGRSRKAYRKGRSRKTYRRSRR